MFGFVVLLIIDLWFGQLCVLFRGVGMWWCVVHLVFTALVV